MYNRNTKFYEFYSTYFYFDNLKRALGGSSLGALGRTQTDKNGFYFILHNEVIYHERVKNRMIIKTFTTAELENGNGKTITCRQIIF